MRPQHFNSWNQISKKQQSSVRQNLEDWKEQTSQLGLFFFPPSRLRRLNEDLLYHHSTKSSARLCRSLQNKPHIIQESFTKRTLFISKTHSGQKTAPFCHRARNTFLYALLPCFHIQHLWDPNGFWQTQRVSLRPFTTFCSNLNLILVSPAQVQPNVKKYTSEWGKPVKNTSELRGIQTSGNICVTHPVSSKNKINYDRYNPE